MERKTTKYETKLMGKGYTLRQSFPNKDAAEELVATLRKEGNVACSFGVKRLAGSAKGVKNVVVYAKTKRARKTPVPKPKVPGAKRGRPKKNATLPTVDEV